MRTPSYFEHQALMNSLGLIPFLGMAGALQPKGDPSGLASTLMQIMHESRPNEVKEEESQTKK